MIWAEQLGTNLGGLSVNETDQRTAVACMYLSWVTARQIGNLMFRKTDRFGA